MWSIGRVTIQRPNKIYMQLFCERNDFYKKFNMIDWCLMPTSAIFHLYRGINFYMKFTVGGKSTYIYIMYIV